MRGFYLAYRPLEIVAQPVRQLKSGANVAQPVRQLKAKTKVAQAVTELEGWELPHAVAEMPWGHNIVLLSKCTDTAQRLWYAAKTLEHGWSRAVLTVQIESDLYGRQGKAITNFGGRLPAPQSEPGPNQQRAIHGSCSP